MERTHVSGVDSDGLGGGVGRRPSLRECAQKRTPNSPDDKSSCVVFQWNQLFFFWGGGSELLDGLGDDAESIPKTLTPQLC